VMVAPPLDAGAVKATEARALPPVAVAPVVRTAVVMVVPEVPT